MQIDPYNSINDSIYLAAKLEKNKRFMNRIQNFITLYNSLISRYSVFN